MLQYINNHIWQYNDLPVEVVTRLLNFMGNLLETLENKKTNDKQIGFLLEFITFDMIQKYLTAHNKENKSTNKIEVIGDNKDLNELVMNKILKGK